MTVASRLWMSNSTSSTCRFWRLEAKATFEERCRQDQRVDRRRPLVRSGLDGPAVLAHQRGRRAVGDDLAVGEGLGPGDVIQVPVTEDHPDAAGAELLERRAESCGHARRRRACRRRSPLRRRRWQSCRCRARAPRRRPSCRSAPRLRPGRARHRSRADCRRGGGYACRPCSRGLLEIRLQKVHEDP